MDEGDHLALVSRYTAMGLLTLASPVPDVLAQPDDEAAFPLRPEMFQRW